MNKKIYVLFIGLALCVAARAQFPGWAWEQTPVGTASGYLDVSSCATDAGGNLYVAGNFAGPSIVLGNYALTTHDTGIGSSDFYLAKYDASGNVLWAQSAGGNYGCYSHGVAIDTSGNIYVCGWFFGDSMVFPGKVLRNQRIIVLIQAGNGFIAKYDPAGNFLWATAEDTTSYGVVLLNGIAASPAGGIYVTGAVESAPIIFNGDTVIQGLNNSSDALLMKVSSSGTVTWARNTGGSVNVFSAAQAVAVDRNNRAYTTGFYQGGSLLVGANTLGNAGSNDIFIDAYDAEGNSVWAQSAGGAQSDIAFGLASDASNNIYATGIFYSDSLTFGSITLNRHDTTTNSSDFFVVKYDSAGNALWAQQAWGDKYNHGQRIATDDLGNVFITGTFSSPTLNFGSLSLTSAGGDDGFIANYNTSGALQWVQAIQGPQNDYPAGVTGDGNGNCYVVGSSNSISIPFGNSTFTNPDTPAYAIFVVKAGTATGIIQPLVAAQFMLYPNPCFTGNCRLVLTDNMTGSTLKIFDISGRLIYKSEIENAVSQIPVLGFDAGVYVVTVTTAQNEISGKLIVGR